MANLKNPTKVILGKNTLWSYANLWAAKAIAEGAVPKYSLSCIIKKDSPDVEKVKAAILAAYTYENNNFDTLKCIKIVLLTR